MATEAVHVALEEKILVTVGRDGGLQGLEVLGLLTLRVAEESLGRWAGHLGPVIYRVFFLTGPPKIWLSPNPFMKSHTLTFFLGFYY